MMSMARNPGAGNFYLRRFFRIYPLSTLVILLVILFHVPISPAKSFVTPRAFDLVSNFCLTTNLTYSPVVLGPLWSLPLEIQMYAVLPLLFLLINKPHALRNLLILWAALIPLAYIQPLISLRIDIVQFAPCFLGGIIAYVLLGRWQPRFHWSWWIIFIVINYAAYEFFDIRRRGWAACLAMGIAIPLFRQVKLPILRRTAAEIAKYSYGIYLFHTIGLYLCLRFVPGSLSLKIAASIAFTAIASFVSFHIIEDPLIHYGQRLARSLWPSNPPAKTPVAPPDLPDIQLGQACAASSQEPALGKAVAS